MLLLASEMPFRRIVGIEMREDLHQQANDNLRRFRRLKTRCRNVESVLANATHYDLPNEKIVVYLFNPFGGDVLLTVLRRLDESFEQHPREIVLVYVHPESRVLLKEMRYFHLYRETTRYYIAKTQVDRSATNYTCAG